jgi:hypothetical protein
MPRSWAYVLIKQQEMCTESSLLRLASIARRGGLFLGYGWLVPVQV